MCPQDIMVYISLFFLFSTAFPKGCTSYESPHSVTCLQTLWKSAGCTRNGSLFSTILDDINLAEQNMNLR